MTDPHARLPDPARSRLRATVATVETAMSQLSAAAAAEAAAPGGLAEAWQELVVLLALGPEPAYRQCPACGHTGMRDARVCGHCWAKLAPVEESAPVVQLAPAAAT